MKVTTEFCESVLSEYSKRFTESDLRHGYKGADIQTARIAMEVFRIALEKLDAQENQDSQDPSI